MCDDYIGDIDSGDSEIDSLETSLDTLVEVEEATLDVETVMDMGEDDFAQFEEAEPIEEVEIVEETELVENVEATGEADEPLEMPEDDASDHFADTYQLKPDVDYTANGADYHTNETGHIGSFSADLELGDAADRSQSHQRNLEGKLPGDHAGHLVSSERGGSGEIDNLVPMDGKVNTRDYRAFERENNHILENGYDVHVDGSLAYGSGEARPDAIMTTRDIINEAGEVVDTEHFSWTNTDMAQFENDNNDWYDDSIPNAMDEGERLTDAEQEEIAGIKEVNPFARKDDGDMGGAEQLEYASDTPEAATDVSSEIDSIMESGGDDYEQFEESDARVLVRDERELLEMGYRNVNEMLDVKADDYRLQGYSEAELSDLLARDKWDEQQQFLNDAFPGQNVSPHVFNGFEEKGASSRIEEINNSASLAEHIHEDYSLPEGSIESLEAMNDAQSEIPGDMADVDSIMESGGDDFAQFEEMAAEVPQNAEFDETQINYDEILEGIEQEALNEGFAHINIDSDPERLSSSLDNFTDETWQGLTIDEQKGSMQNLADYVVETVGFENPPRIEYYNNERQGDYGGYSAETNTLSVNEYMLYDNAEAADTIVHELWHAYQHERSINPQNARDFQYQYNFDNYISPDLGQEAYENQLLEAEARAFAGQIKDRLRGRAG